MTSKNRMYIIEAESGFRESQAIRRLFENPLLTESLLQPMGVSAPSWVLIEIDNAHLVPSLDGEIDILAGSAEFRNPEPGAFPWPPTPSYVVGIEVKCCYFSEALHSAKASPSKLKDIRKKLVRLEKMGVDRFAHLDVIANQPADGLDSNPWLKAAGRALTSLDDAKEILESRLPIDTCAGQFVWPVGAVAGGDESMRGSGLPIELRHASPNPRLRANDQSTLTNREILLSNLSKTLGAQPRPKFFPAIFVGCPSCRRVRPFHDTVCGCSKATCTA